MTATPVTSTRGAQGQQPVDAETVRAAQRGDAEAFGLLVQEPHAGLRAVAIASLGYVDEDDTTLAGYNAWLQGLAARRGER